MGFSTAVPAPVLTGGGGFSSEVVMLADASVGGTCQGCHQSRTGVFHHVNRKQEKKVVLFYYPNSPMLQVSSETTRRLY